MNNPNFNNSVEITAPAFGSLRGNEEQSWHDYKSNELCEWTTYINNGVKLMAIYNFLSGVTQYFVQDINA